MAWNSRVVRRIPCMYVDACTYLRRGEECCVFSLETHLVDIRPHISVVRRHLP